MKDFRSIRCAASLSKHFSTMARRLDFSPAGMEINMGAKPDAASERKAAAAKCRPTLSSVITAQRGPSLSNAHSTPNRDSKPPPTLMA